MNNLKRLFRPSQSSNPDLDVTDGSSGGDRDAAMPVENEDRLIVDRQDNQAEHSPPPTPPTPPSTRRNSESEEAEADQPTGQGQQQQQPEAGFDIDAYEQNQLEMAIANAQANAAQEGGNDPGVVRFDDERFEDNGSMVKALGNLKRTVGVFADNALKRREKRERLPVPPANAPPQERSACGNSRALKSLRAVPMLGEAAAWTRERHEDILHSPHKAVKLYEFFLMGLVMLSAAHTFFFNFLESIERMFSTKTMRDVYQDMDSLAYYVMRRIDRFLGDLIEFLTDTLPCFLKVEYAMVKEEFKRWLQHHWIFPVAQRVMQSGVFRGVSGLVGFVFGFSVDVVLKMGRFVESFTKTSYFSRRADVGAE